MNKETNKGRTETTEEETPLSFTEALEEISSSPLSIKEKVKVFISHPDFSMKLAAYCFVFYLVILYAIFFI